MLPHASHNQYYHNCTPERNMQWFGNIDFNVFRYHVYTSLFKRLFIYLDVCQSQRRKLRKVLQAGRSIKYVYLKWLEKNLELNYHIRILKILFYTLN